MSGSIAAILEEVFGLCRAAGRDPSGVQVVAASKSRTVDEIIRLRRAGVRAFGENYVQEWRAKADQLGEAVEWHIIGPVQTNKLKYIVGRVHLIHSVDRDKQLREIQRLAVQKKVHQDVLVQVNLSGEASKSGLRSEQLPELLKAAADCDRVRVRGLMTFPPFARDPEENRPFFMQLRRLTEVYGGFFRGNGSACVPELSMGTSGDYAVAVQEGATLIRLGRALFERAA